MLVLGVVDSVDAATSLGSNYTQSRLTCDALITSSRQVMSALRFSVPFRAE